MTGPSITTPIAVLGLGAMGSRIATRLLSTGHDVIVWNRSPHGADPLLALGAQAAASPRDAAERAAMVLSCVTDDDASRRVWLHTDTGARHGLSDTSIAIELSTLTPAWVHRLATEIRHTGAAFVDAPVVGSRPQADAGQLIFLVGGDDAVVARVSPLLERIGAAVHHAGQTGDGAKLKLAVNALFASQVAAYAELTGYLRRAGVSPTAIALIATLPVMSPALQGAAFQMAHGAYPPLFPVGLVEKDLRYLMTSAAASGCDVAVTNATHAQYAAAVAKAMGADNIAGVAQLYR